MALISAPDLAILRSKNHQAQIYGTFMSPPILWTAQVNGNQSAGEILIPFNNGSGANFNLIEAEQEVWFGTTPNDLVNFGRIRAISSGDGGVTGTLTIAGNWFTLTSGTWITFTLNYPLRAKYPLLAGTPSAPLFYKDQNILYTDENSNLHPVVVAGGNRAGFTSFVVNPHLENSYTMTPSATISSYSATSLSLDGTPTISINGSTGIGTITFTTAGQYWIKYTITDSNGRSQSSYRYYYAHSTDPTSEHYPYTNFTCNSIQGDWENGGWQAGVKFHADADSVTENMIAILWQVAKYDGDEDEIGFSYNTLISGYLTKETISENIFTDIGGVDFAIVTIQTLLQNHYMFSISLEARTSPDDWYQFRVELTNLRGVHHLWKWHSTLMEICDVVGLNTDTDMLRPFVELEDGNLFTMADNLIRNEGIRYHVVCDKNGVINTIPDVQLLTDAERVGIPEVFEIDYEDRSEEIVIVRETRHRVVLTKVSGFYWDGTFQSDPDLCPNIAETGIPCPNSTPYCSESPARIPDDEGGTIVDLDRQTLRSQAHCNEIAGRLFGQLNLEYTEYRINFHGNYSGVLDVAYPYYWTITMQADDTIRSEPVGDINLICRSVSLTPNVATGVITCSAIFEPESGTFPGIAGVCLDDLPEEIGTTPSSTVPTGSGGIPIVTGSSVWFKPGLSNVWDLRSNEDVRDLRVDPFWKERQGTSDAEYSIIWRCGAAYIKVSEDGGKTWQDRTPSGVPNDAGDSPAPTVPDLVFEHMDVSWHTQGEFVFLAYWFNNSVGSPTFGERRTWIVYTNDDGTNWSWESIIVDTSFQTYASTVFGNLIYNPVDSYRTYTASCEYEGLIYFGSARVTAGGDCRLFSYNGSDTYLTSVSNFSTGRVITDMLDFDGNLWLLVTKSPFSPTTPYISEIWYYDGISVALHYTFSSLIGSPPTEDMIRLSKDDTYLYISFTGDSSGGIVDTLYKLSSTGSSWTPVSIGLSTETSGQVFTYKNKTYFTKLNHTILPYYERVVDEFGTEYFRYDDELQNFAVFDNVLYFSATDGGDSKLFSWTGSGIPTEEGNFTDYVYTNWFGYTGGKIRNITVDWFDRIHIFGDTASSSIRIFHYDLSTFNFIPYSNDSIALENYRHTRTTVFNDSIYTTVGFITSSGTENIQRGDLISFPSTSYNVHPLGIAIGKGDNRLQATVLDIDNEKLYLQKFTDPTTFNESFLMGENITYDMYATRRFFLYPISSWYATDGFWAFGRFYNPDSLTDIVHILYTDDGGTTWRIYQEDWTTDHCGAFFESINGITYAVRNNINGYQGKLYVNNTLKRTLPFNAGINPHSIDLDYNGSVYVCSQNNLETIMVVRLPYPYTSYGNITYNHGNTEGIYSIQVLD